LAKLHARCIWHTMIGGKGGLNIWSPDAEDQSIRTKTKQLEEDKPAEDVIEDLPREEARLSEGEDGSWYLGKAKEEFRRRRGKGDSSRGEEDPIQWARDRRDAERERETDFGQEDYFDGGLRQRDREDIVIDEFSETVLLVLLCIVISLLLYIRTRMVERMRRDQRQQQAQNGRAPLNENGGVFPPGDQGRGDWAVLR